MGVFEGTLVGFEVGERVGVCVGLMVGFGEEGTVVGANDGTADKHRHFENGWLVK